MAYQVKALDAKAHDPSSISGTPTVGESWLPQAGLTSTCALWHTLYPPPPASIPEPENEYMAFYITKQLNEDLEKVNSLKKNVTNSGTSSNVTATHLFLKKLVSRLP